MSDTRVIENESDLDGLSEAELQEELDKLTREPEEDTPAKAEEPPAAPAEAPVTVEALQKQLDELKQHNTRLSKQVQDKEAYILQRNQEIGLLRKRVHDAAPEPDLEGISDEEFAMDPKGAIKKALKLTRQQEESRALKEQEDRAAVNTQLKETVLKFDPEFEKKVPDLLEIMKQDQAPEEIQNAFRSDPLVTFNPAVMFQMLKRVELAKRVKDLEAKLEEAQKRPAAMAAKVQQAGRSKPVTTSLPPSPRPHKTLDTLTEEDIDRMSSEELAQLEKELIRSK